MEVGNRERGDIREVLDSSFQPPTSRLIMFRYIYVDLHVHTVLSPCAEVEMIPPFIVAQARQLGLSLIAITDHNSAENVAAVIEAARQTGLTVLPGMEVESREEAHIICLFDAVEQALAWQEEVYAHLPPLKNREETFGAQFVVDAEGQYVRTNDRLLLTSTSLSVNEVVKGVRALGGLPLPAHVDRPSYSLIANLGFIPPDLGLAAVEISSRTSPDEVRARFPQLQDYNLVVSGDAHRLNEMVARTMVKVREPTVAELALALAGREDRRIVE